MVDNTGHNTSDKERPLKYTTSASHGGGFDEIASIKEHDRLLPIANIGRIMKQILPPTAKVSKEAKETMQEYVSEFISFVTGEASDKCHREKRKTVNGNDISWALASFGFDEYSETLRMYLVRYREAEAEKASQNRGGGVEERHEDEHRPADGRDGRRRAGGSRTTFGFDLMEDRRN